MQGGCSGICGELHNRILTDQLGCPPGFITTVHPADPRSVEGSVYIGRPLRVKASVHVVHPLGVKASVHAVYPLRVKAARHSATPLGLESSGHPRSVIVLARTTFVGGFEV